MRNVFGINPDAPKSMQRRITAGSWFADTITTGTLGYCARMYMRPENPRTPSMVRSSNNSPMSLVQQLGNIVEAVGLGDIPALEQTGHHLAKRESEQRMIIG